MYEKKKRLNKLRVSLHTELQLYMYEKKKSLNKSRVPLHTELQLYTYAKKKRLIKSSSSYRIATTYVLKRRKGLIN